MRESKFVEQNKDKWEHYEQSLKLGKQDPAELRSYLIQVTDDLSFSRTYYKNRSVRVYLNGLAQRIYHNIYKNRKNLWKGIKQFYVDDVPRILFFSRKELLVSFLIFLLSVGIGILSSAKDIEFANSILGSDYVEMTKSNIRDGNPFGVYKQQESFTMFVSIAINNIRVALFIFLFGLFASYGAIVLMIRNGIMLGVFMFFFYSRHLSSEFNYTVWMHGSIEILTLVIETVAGMLLGRGLIYPGTLSRPKAFSVWGRRGAMLFLSTIPFIIVAAFIESYITRHTDISNVVRGFFILVSIALMVFYFVVFPYYKFRNNKDAELGIPDIVADSELDFNREFIYSSGTILLKSINLINKNFSKIMRFAFISTVVVMIGFLATEQKYLLTKYKLVSTDFLDLIQGFFRLKFEFIEKLYENTSLLLNSGKSPWLYLGNALWLAAIAFFVFKLFKDTFHKSENNSKEILIHVILFSFSISAFLLFEGFIGKLLFWLFIGPFTMVMYRAIVENENKGVLRNLMDIFRNGFIRVLGNMVLIQLLNLICMIFIITPIYYISIYLMEMNVEMSNEMYQLWMKTISMFALMLVMCFVFIFQLIQSIFLSYTIKEIIEAEGLMKKIAEVGKSNKAYGMETE